MNTSSRRTSTPTRGKAPPPARPASAVTSTGTQRVYIDLPVESVRRFNVLAAMRSLPKRKLLEQIVEDALKAADV